LNFWWLANWPLARPKELIVNIDLPGMLIRAGAANGS
jgi:hypothetical protein